MSVNPPQPPLDPRDARAQAKAAKAYAKARRPWYKKKRFIIPLILIVLIVIISIATANGGDDNTLTDTSGSGESGSTGQASGSGNTGQTTQPPAFPGAEESDVIGQAGAALVLKDISVTSTPLRTGDSAFGGSTLCTTATIQNNSDETIDFNAYDWKLQAPSGTIKDTSFAGSQNALSSGQLAPGGTATGDVCFENEPAESGVFIVLYEPLLDWFSDRGAWINNL